MNFTPKNILILGAGHGLGLALAKECMSRFSQAKILTTYRRKEKATELLDLKIAAYHLDPLNEEEVKSFTKDIEEIDLFINCVGFLSDESYGPEKSLKDINVEQLTFEFQVNAFVTPLWAKYLKDKLPKNSPSIFTTLSAMVGSITENEVGGWYGYRASKSALNMFIKTISIEFKRSRIPCSVLAIHPGTTQTDLSKDFLKGIKHKIWVPEEASVNILNVLMSRQEGDTGLFLNWDERKIPW